MARVRGVGLMVDALWSLAIGIEILRAAPASRASSRSLNALFFGPPLARFQTNRGPSLTCRVSSDQSLLENRAGFSWSEKARAGQWRLSGLLRSKAAPHVDPRADRSICLYVQGEVCLVAV